MSEPQNPYLELSGFARREAGERVCDHPDCSAAGLYRAPKSRDQLRDYFWFCLEHVREYNAAWNYFAEMSEDEIERYRRQDPSWHRPTWPFAGSSRSTKGSRRADPGFADAELGDPLHIFRTMGGNGHRFGERAYTGRGAKPLTAEDRAALDRLDLDESASRDDIRRAYRRLAKRYHPDANGGNAGAAERFKGVVDAYRHLLASLKTV